MATPRDRTTDPKPHPRRGSIDPSAPWPLRALMAVYRFLASLKLAVISISSLAAVLAYGTYFESRHGTPAAQEYVYQSVGFSILLAFLGTNVLCAALIRYPWKRRQIGFLVTHAGLITLIVGAWWGFQYSDEGQAGAPEGGVIDKLVRTQDPVVRVRPIDARTGKMDGEFELPFKGGPFDWPEGKSQVISKPKDPFKVAVKAYYPASARKRVRLATQDGTPMLRLRPKVKPPGAKAFADVFEDPEQRWFAIPERAMGHRVSRKAGPAKFAFLYVDRPEIVEDFLNPPENPGDLGVARLRYADRSGKARTFEVRIDDARPDRPIPLPDSDLTATFVAAERRDTENPSFVQMLGDSQLSVVKFNVRKGSGPEVLHAGFAAQPMIPAVLPTEKGRRQDEALVTIGYYRPPALGGGGMAGNFGAVEVMGDPQGRLYYRVFGRDQAPPPDGQSKGSRTAVLKGKPGPLKIDEDVVAFGGNPNMPMTLAFRAEAYIPSAEDKVIYVPFELDVGKRGNGLAAVLLEMTAGDETKEVWLQRPPGLVSRFTPVSFKSGKEFEVAYDFDRKDLGFSLKLNNFEVGFDPGTAQASSFASEVTLTDEAKGIKDRPITISMNQPLTHRQYTFYQSSYERLVDPRTERPTGEFQSVLQVGHDAGRTLKYVGSLLVVLGSFLQFYIVKSGVFSEGATDNRHKAADNARRLLARKASPAVEPPPARPAKAKRSKNYDDAIL